MISLERPHCLSVVFQLVVGLAAGISSAAGEPVAYFVDGYHGGVYGHYPPGYTGFLVEQLRANPDWKISLEIEPETWDVARVSEPAAYEALKAIMADQSDAGRIEYVNPTYAQSYFFQGSGESVIRQFDYGMRKLNEHFPNLRYTTYSSEEPCYTSCLPSILRSFGYEFAVLKNPNTCWGGYTSAYGGELVNWIGPDGASILAVPRYACESLHPDSCWQTIAFGNSPAYIEACLQQGIEHPAGMCLQDAGWRGGPWLAWSEKDHYRPSKYVTWRDYIRNVTPARSSDGWRFTQEDVKPGLMWGAQVLQRIAQQSRAAELQLLMAEKLAAMALIDAGLPPQTAAMDEAWRNVLLSQHHDCWIVPYNGRPQHTWAAQVRRWTTLANAVSELSLQRSIDALIDGRRGRRRHSVRLFNSTGATLDMVVPTPVPADGEVPRMVSVDAEGRRFATQVAASPGSGQRELLVRAVIPPLGYTTVELRPDAEVGETPLAVIRSGDSFVIESDCYRIELDPAQGGVIRSLVAKQLGNREFVDLRHERRFNELRGRFYEKGGLHSSADQPAKITIVENGPLRAIVEIAGDVAGSPFVQRIALTHGSPIIDCSVRIDWRGNPRIGEFKDDDGWHNRRRAAYDDRFKLLALFPVKLKQQQIAKSAPFDVCESRLADTFYNTWEDIKHNLIVDWVDVTDGAGQYGLALFSDHTTSYTHGENFPLGLTLQYAGKGLWSRDYRVEGPTYVRYALLPHAGRWDEADVPAAAAAWQEPPLGVVCPSGQRSSRSLIDPGESGWTAPAMFAKDDDLYVRLFNASEDDGPHGLGVGFESEKIELVELDGRVVEELAHAIDDAGRRTIRLSIPRFGVRTLRFRGVRTFESD